MKLLATGLLLLLLTQLVLVLYASRPGQAEDKLDNGIFYATAAVWVGGVVLAGAVLIKPM